MKRILDLMKADIITMNGGKNSMKTSLVLMLVIFGGMGFVFAPMLGIVCPLMISVLLVPALFQNEMKYHSEKLHSILPIRRRDLVNARFLLMYGIYVVMFAAFYLFMLLSMKVKIFYMIMGDDAKNIDTMALAVKASQGAFTELGLFNLLYFISFSYGCFIMGSQLRKYFKNKEVFDTSLSLGKGGKGDKKELVIGALIVCLLILIILTLTGILPLMSLIMPILQLFIQLAMAANGVLLGVMMVIMALFSAVYKYICAVFEYEDKEL